MGFILKKLVCCFEAKLGDKTIGRKKYFLKLKKYFSKLHMLEGARCFKLRTGFIHKRYSYKTTHVTKGQMF